MTLILAHPALTDQDAPPPSSLSDARAAAVMGLALANARQHIADALALAHTAGTQFDAARQSVLIVVGKAAEVQPDMTVTELHNLLSTGRR